MLLSWGINLIIMAITTSMIPKERTTEAITLNPWQGESISDTHRINWTKMRA
jgi:hypothetical protein